MYSRKEGSCREYRLMLTRKDASQEYCFLDHEKKEEKEEKETKCLPMNPHKKQ